MTQGLPISLPGRQSPWFLPRPSPSCTAFAGLTWRRTPPACCVNLATPPRTVPCLALGDSACLGSAGIQQRCGWRSSRHVSLPSYGRRTGDQPDFMGNSTARPGVPSCTDQRLGLAGAGLFAIRPHAAFVSHSSRRATCRNLPVGDPPLRQVVRTVVSESGRARVQ